MKMPPRFPEDFERVTMPQWFCPFGCGEAADDTQIRDGLEWYVCEGCAAYWPSESQWTEEGMRKAVEHQAYQNELKRLRRKGLENSSAEELLDLFSNMPREELAELVSVNPGDIE